MTAALATDPPFAIRPGVEEDAGYILNTWRNGFAHESKLCRFDRSVYFSVIAKHIRAVRRESGAVVMVACDPSNPTTILGFAVLTGSELHYVDVRQTLRRLGIARALLDGLRVKTYALRTKAGEDRLKPAERGWTYAPRSLSGRDGKVLVEIS